MAAPSASTALANSIMAPSPVSLISRPRVTPHGRLDAFDPMRLEAEVRAAFIAAHQAGIAHDVDAHDRRQPSHYLFAGLHCSPIRQDHGL